MLTREPILHIDKLVFVNLDKEGFPKPHGKTAITYIKDRLNTIEMSMQAASNNPNGDDSAATE
jgi:hypothetical protein